MNMNNVKKLIVEKESINVIGRGVEVFFFEIVQSITSMPLPTRYDATFVIPFIKGKMPYVIASLFRECEKDNESSTITHLINEIANMHGFECVAPLSKKCAEYSQLASSLAYDFEAIFVRIDLKETKLPTSIFGNWQNRAIDYIERLEVIVKAANRIEEVIADKAYEYVHAKPRISNSNPNYYYDITINLNQYLPDDILKLFGKEEKSELCSILEKKFKRNDTLIEFVVSPVLEEESIYSEKELVPSVDCRLSIYFKNIKPADVTESISAIGKRNYEECKESIDLYLKEVASKFNN